MQPSIWKKGGKKKKGNGHRRVKTRFCGGRNGIVPRGFSIWPPEEVIFKDIRFFLMVINIFLAILFNVFYLFCVDKNLQGLFLQIWPWGWTTSLLVHHNIIEEFHKDRWRKGEIKLGRQKKNDNKKTLKIFFTAIQQVVDGPPTSPFFLSFWKLTFIRRHSHTFADFDGGEKGKQKRAEIPQRHKIFEFSWAIEEQSFVFSAVTWSQYLSQSAW